MQLLAGAEIEAEKSDERGPGGKRRDVASSESEGKCESPWKKFGERPGPRPNEYSFSGLRTVKVTAWRELGDFGKRKTLSKVPSGVYCTTRARAMS